MQSLVCYKICYSSSLSWFHLLQFTPQRPGTRPVSDAERIHAEVEDQLTNCQCHSQFSMVRIDDGKYKVLGLVAMSLRFTLEISLK